MKQTYRQEIETEVSLDRSVGNLFADFLESKKVPMSDFDSWAERVIISLDGVVLRLKEGGFPAKVSEVIKMIIKPEQEIKFLPAVAAG